jgi:hypothetical protein
MPSIQPVLIGAAMDPLTGVVVIASQYGIRAVLRALTGGDDVGDFAAEIVGALSASEDRLEERLARMEDQLSQVLDQQYTTGLKVGKRILSDAVPGARSKVREKELGHARDAFRKASASARTPLQEALAERYLALCLISLGQTRAAGASVHRLEGAATDALLTTYETRMDSWHRAEEATKKERNFRKLFDRERYTAERQTAIDDAALEEAVLAFRLVEEAGLLRLGLSDQDAQARARWGERPVLSIYSQSREEVSSWSSWAQAFWRVNVEANTATPEVVRVGAISVRLNRFEVRKLRVADAVKLDYSIQIDPPLSRPVQVWLLTPGAKWISDQTLSVDMSSATGAPVEPVWDERIPTIFSIRSGAVRVRIRMTFTAFEVSARGLAPALSLGGIFSVKLRSLKPVSHS